MIHRHPLSLTDKIPDDNTALEFAEHPQYNAEGNAKLVLDLLACKEIQNVLRLTPTTHISSTPFPTLL